MTYTRKKTSATPPQRRRQARNRARRGPQKVNAGLLIMLSRTRAELTQADLAERLGISQPAVAQLERGSSNPRIDTLERALRAADAQLVIEARFPPEAPGEPEGLRLPADADRPQGAPARRPSRV